MLNNGAKWYNFSPPRWSFIAPPLMSLAEFTKAWLDGEFDGDRERHGNVIFLASMLPEYWTDSN